MKKVLTVAANLLGLYLIGWSVIWTVALICGAPANLGEWYPAARVLTGIFGAPIVSLGLMSIAGELK